LKIAGAAVVTTAVLLAFVLVIRNRTVDQHVEGNAATSPPIAHSAQEATVPVAQAHAGFLYGRITTVDGATHEGRLRWGGDQEAFWTDHFNGAKNNNPWAAHLPTDPSPFEIFGFKIGGQQPNLNRLFMARFGDIVRIEARVWTVRVTLKSGTVVDLDRNATGDIDDGVRVWAAGHEAIDLDARRIRLIDFLPTAPLDSAPTRLHGTVRTRKGDFTGFIQWDQQDSVGTDMLDGRGDAGEHRLHYDTIRSIARHSRDKALVALVDGRELVLSNSREFGPSNRGIHVDDRRYGRVLITWDAFERVDFSPRDSSGPAYRDFPAGQRLTGSVETRDGRRLAGRLVYDFDESETTETFDGQFQGVDYNIPFRLITSIVPAARDGGGDQRGTLLLHGGEELPLDRDGDFADRNLGLLVFVDGGERPQYVPWNNVVRIDLDRRASQP
jgi:hypothetical protein